MLRIASLSICLALCSLHAASGQQNDEYHQSRLSEPDQSSQHREPVEPLGHYGRVSTYRPRQNEQRELLEPVRQYGGGSELDQSSQHREPVEPLGQYGRESTYRPRQNEQHEPLEPVRQYGGGSELDQSSQHREPVEPLGQYGRESVARQPATYRPRQNEQREPLEPVRQYGGDSGMAQRRPESASQSGQPFYPNQPIGTQGSSDRHRPLTGGSCDHCPCDCSATGPLAVSGAATAHRPEVTIVENPEDNVIDSPANQERAKSLSQGLTFFAHHMYRSLRRQQPGNVFFSPLSIHAVLAMASVGASNVTLDQLKMGLSLPEEEKITTHGYRHLIKDLNSMTDNGMTVKVANKIFVNQLVTVKPSYKDVTRESFHSEIESIDFRQASQARSIINKWVEDNTNNKIKNIISTGLSPNTAMVLVNAMYFKGTWKVMFDAEETRERKFYVTPQKTVDVDMMHASGDFPITFNQELDCKILEMYYNNGKISMVIVLPNKLDGLAALENKLTPDRISQLHVPEGEFLDTSVYLPKFKLEESVQLNEILRQMGMVDLFESSANFSRISKSGLNVGQVAHKSFVEINEEGTEAAVATVFSVSLSAHGSHNAVPFNADHPFLFLVRHTQLNQILFMGRFKSPPARQAAPARQGIKTG